MNVKLFPFLMKPIPCPAPASYSDDHPQYVSVDGGAHWQSTLVPEYSQDTSARRMNSILHGFTTAANPVPASGTHGMFYYGGVAFNRGSSLGTGLCRRN